MKTTKRLALILFCTVFFVAHSVNAQINNKELKTKVKIKNNQIIPKKITKWDLRLNTKKFNGEYVLFESDLYVAHLKRKKGRLQYQKKNAAKPSKSSGKVWKKANHEMTVVNNQIKTIKENPKQYDYSLNNGSDCGKRITQQICDNIKNAMRIETIEEDEIPRDCPDDTRPHCFPININRNLKYLVLPKSVTKFKAVFYDVRGVKIGSTGKPLLIDGDKNHIVYPVNIKNSKGNIFVKVFRSGPKLKGSYLAAIKMN
ncbi:hypothetical protein [Aquimarina sp. AU474]|uniref:hypothetical protein n=1 Tax=Aquimarina sp. AU474 TaxID=2108529 RepID=UPI000D686EF2|nr:hypothetical protein [Aquimarina sp. AU474]